jgi:uncharacterized protein YjiS (DUF1127 family)
MEGAMSWSRPLRPPLPSTRADRPRIVRIPPTVVAAWRLWRQRRCDRRCLAALDTRSLRDLGISPELADYELRQPFWRPMRDRRH